MKRIRSTLHGDLGTVLIASRRILLEWGIFRTKLIEKINTCGLCSVTYFPKAVPFMSSCGQIWQSRTGCGWQCSMAYELYLYNKQHNALIHYFILRFCFTCFGLSNSPSSRGYVYNVANGDYLLECRLSMGQDGALIRYFILWFCLTCFGLSYSPSSRGYVHNVANGDYLLWAHHQEATCTMWQMVIISMGQNGAELRSAPSWPIDSRHSRR
jgi:hypothetical protein